MPTLDQVREDALALSRDDREILSIELAMSMKQEPGYDESWAREIDRRRAAIATGNMALTDSAEAEAIIFGDDD